ncbi:hypothetical protein D3Y57_05155 (plasmid) [Sphingomonas paeninsulae]|jgi:hypothetical protein|uniref:Uncharacterized protein n=1 Tax=Sphingomonas paeninsulae TaxID=2319844 RepID=A0A494TJT5_SPHPE|nr:hypothetical protein [Sphingomonas paeninsulae]AYJ85385.1 hypothetical protein D3Y57_05155 [Sphingomonas paeninsulae]
MNTLDSGSSDQSLVILQSLICLLREKNLLSRADIEGLCEKVTMRATQAERDPLPCSLETARAAAGEMARIGEHIGKHYGGKHRRG